MDKISFATKLQIGTHPPITAAQIGLRIRLNITQCVATLKATIHFHHAEHLLCFCFGFSILSCPATNTRMQPFFPFT